MTFLPVVTRELCVASRQAYTYWSRFWVVLAGMLIFILIMLGSIRDPVSLGKDIFIFISILVLIFCQFCGVFLTADSISREYKDGTLGLLFLTDLKPTDVVLGKMAASSLHSVFGVIALIPILALPLFLGGVSIQEFMRMVMLFLVTVFFSLSLGMWVSARFHASGNTIVLTLIFILLITVGSIGVGFLYHVIVTGSTGETFLLASPYYALSLVFDITFKPAYWHSLMMLSGLGVAGIVDSGRLLPGIWRGKKTGKAVDVVKRKWTFRGPVTSALAAVWMQANPLYWLMRRESKGFVWILLVFVILGLLWLTGIIGMIAQTRNGLKEDYFALCIFTLLATHIIAKIFMIVEASRRFFEDKQSGALELILATPLTAEEIVAGYWRGLKGLFIPFIVVLMILNVLTFILGFSNRGFDGEARLPFMLCLFGSSILIWSDFYAIGWLGLYRSLIGRQHYRAVLFIVSIILLPPWLANFFLIVLHINWGADMASTVITLWLLGSAALSFVAGSHARLLIITSFRSLASGSKPRL